MEKGSNVTAAGRFFETLMAKDLPGWVDLFAEDANMELPFHPPGFHAERHGRNAIERTMGEAFEVWEEVHFTGPTLYETTDPDVVIAETSGNIKLSTGGHYRNTFIMLFFFSEGKITLWREYLNPLVLVDAHTGGDAEKLAEMFPDPNAPAVD
jgi:ketosteroid isomerase-like protein